MIRLIKGLAMMRLFIHILRLGRRQRDRLFETHSFAIMGVPLLPLRSKLQSLLIFFWLDRCCERSEAFFRNEKWLLQGLNRRFLLLIQVFKVEIQSILLITKISAKDLIDYFDGFRQQISLFPFPQDKDAWESTS